MTWDEQKFILVASFDDGAYDHLKTFSTSRCYVNLEGCNGSRNTNVQYIHVYNFDEYVPITVILFMLSENSLL